MTCSIPRYFSRPSRFGALVILSLFVFSCRPSVQERPIGYGNLGPIASYRKQELAENYDHALIIRQDLKGLYVMSTLCTRELRRLKAKKGENGAILFCDVCGSEYNENGKVIKGPAKEDLPYYNLEIAEGKPHGPHDTLYARIGMKVSPSWRLPFPEVIPGEAQKSP